MRLRTVSSQGPGWRRLRHGRGFRYVDANGQALSAADVERVKELVIPPAWTDVWVCPDERGHLQAVGTDDAGRRQYLYHPEWRRKRDEAKFDRAVEFGRRLPRMRAALNEALAGDPSERATVVAAAVRLLDLGCFRLGSQAYTDENGSFGLTTLEVRHVHRAGDVRLFKFVGKSGIEHEIAVDDPAVLRIVDAVSHRRRGDTHLLATLDGRRRSPILAGEVNDLIHTLSRMEATAKDFRTWKSTVAVAAELAGVERAESKTARARQVRDAIVVASELLGNTPTVAKSSYVDPRVLDLFDNGVVMGRARSEDGRDRAAVRLLSP